MKSQRSILIRYEGGHPVCENLENHFRRRLIVRTFPKEKLVEGLIPKGLLVRGLWIKGVWSQTGRITNVWAGGLLFRVRTCRRWSKDGERDGESFLVDFELASDEENALHSVMTE